MTDGGDDQQQQVLNFLSELTDRSGAKVIRIDTHAASVFLVDDKAYKIKRAVKFPFLDYSTLEKRRIACEAELTINRPFAPSIYLAVVPLTRDSAGRHSISGTGSIVEWALEMRRFDETQTLDLLVPAGRFDDASADQLGRTVAEMHSKAKPADSATWLAALARCIAQNTTALRSRPSLFSNHQVDLLDRYCLSCFDALLPMLRSRAERGLIRRCHGDLHLANVTILEGKPLPFDAIEFDETIASGDVMYDLAFLLMDFIKFGSSHAATIVLNRYLNETYASGGYDGLSVLPLFMSIRAAIRAQVSAANLERGAPKEHEYLADKARSYFQLAERLVNPPPAALIAIGGLSGTGKSVLARSLASFVKPEPGAVLLRSDVERKLLAGAGETDRLPRESYTPEASQRVYGSLRDKAAAVLRCGHSVIVDAVHAAPEERLAIERIATLSGATFKGLFLSADAKTLEARVSLRASDASDANAETVQLQQTYDLGQIDWLPIDASGTPSQAFDNARAALKNP